MSQLSLLSLGTSIHRSKTSTNPASSAIYFPDDPHPTVTQSEIMLTILLIDDRCDGSKEEERTSSDELKIIRASKVVAWFVPAAAWVAQPPP